MTEFLWWCLFNLILTCSLEEKSALGYLENLILGIIIFFVYKDFTLHNFMEKLPSRCVFSITFDWAF